MGIGAQNGSETTSRAEQKLRTDWKMTYKPMKQDENEQNYKKGSRRSQARNQMGNPGLKR